MATEPTASQIMLALKELTGEATLNVSTHGHWYVDARLERCENGCLAGFTAWRNNPEDAVVDYWRMVTSGCALRINSGQPRYIRWSGFMFKEITKEEAHGRC